MKNTFETVYPFLHLYLCYQGYLEIGADDHYDSWIRVMDEGGMRLEVDEKSLDESLVEAETWAEEFMRGNYTKEVEKAGL